MLVLTMYWDVHPEVEKLVGGSKRLLSMTLFAMENFGYHDDDCKLCLIGNPEIEHGYAVSHQEYPDLESVLADHPTEKIVALVGRYPPGIEPVPLNTYRHPEDANYIIGGDYGDIEFDKLKELDVDYVHITGIKEVPHLWASSVAAIVLYDRWIEWQ